MNIIAHISFQSCAGISLSKFLEVDFLGQKVCALVILLDIANLLTTEVLPIYLSPLQRYLRVPEAPHPPPHSVSSRFSILVSLICEMVSCFIFMGESGQLLMSLNAIVFLLQENVYLYPLFILNFVCWSFIDGSSLSIWEMSPS